MWDLKTFKSKHLIKGVPSSAYVGCHVVMFESWSDDKHLTRNNVNRCI